MLLFVAFSCGGCINGLPLRSLLLDVDSENKNGIGLGINEVTQISMAVQGPAMALYVVGAKPQDRQALSEFEYEKVFFEYSLPPEQSLQHFPSPRRKKGRYGSISLALPKREYVAGHLQSMPAVCKSSFLVKVP